MNETLQLSERQQAVLRRVVEEFVGTGEPVGSKTLVARSDLRVSPSTVRSELAELENLGLLTHPHTSAGRVPTERGYRYYADELLGRLVDHCGQTRVLVAGATATALRALGAQVAHEGEGHWRVRGVGVGGGREPDHVLDLGNSGTAASRRRIIWPRVGRPGRSAP